MPEPDIIVYVPQMLSGLKVVGINVGKYLESIGYKVEVTSDPPMDRIFVFKQGDQVIIRRVPAKRKGIPVFMSWHVAPFVCEALYAIHAPKISWMPFLEGYPTIEPNHKEIVHMRHPTIIAPTKFVAEKLEEIGLYYNTIIYPGINPPSKYEIEGWRQHYRRLWKDYFVFLYIAYNQPRKGLDKLVKAAQILSQKTRRKFLVYIFTNSFELPEGTKNVVLDLRFGTLTKEEIHGMIAASDCYVHASMSEGLGVPIVEAMWWGKPIICVDAKPMNELVKPTFGKLVPYYKVELQEYIGIMVFENKVYRPEDLAEAMKEVLEDKHWVAEASAKAKEEARKYHYTVSLRGIEKYVF